MITPETISPLEVDDAELVDLSLRGDRDAFARIVSRYKALVCSLAYSASGSLAASEDLAQETFLTAWKELPFLREPAKLRPWLCGIARNLNHRVRRAQSREPMDEAVHLETLDEIPAPAPSPLDHAISHEEEAILWRVLERIPETYREPLILYYRENQSMVRVADVLDLSQEAVRQRLARGRKLLQDRVLAFVEGSLARSAPGDTFTLGVLAALPIGSTPAKAALGAATLAKGGAAAKTAATVASAGGWWALVGGASLVSFQARAEDTKSPRERMFVWRTLLSRLVVVALLFNGLAYGVAKLSASGYFHQPLHHRLLEAALLPMFFVIAVAFGAYDSRRQRKIQVEDGTFVEAEWQLPRKETESAAGLPGNKSGGYVRTLKYMAVSLSVTLIILFNAPWRQHLALSILFAACFAFSAYSRFQNFKERPRFSSSQLSWYVYPAIAALLGLLYFMTPDFQIPSAPGSLSVTSPVAMIFFIVLILAAYPVRAVIQRMKKARLKL